jgi:hypothetical protein
MTLQRVSFLLTLERALPILSLTFFLSASVSCAKQETQRKSAGAPKPPADTRLDATSSPVQHCLRSVLRWIQKESQPQRTQGRPHHKTLTKVSRKRKTPSRLVQALRKHGNHHLPCASPPRHSSARRANKMRRGRRGKYLYVGARDSDRDGCRCHLQAAKAQRRHPHRAAHRWNRAHRAGCRDPGARQRRKGGRKRGGGLGERNENGTRGRCPHSVRAVRRFSGLWLAGGLLALAWILSVASMRLNAEGRKAQIWLRRIKAA